MLTAPPPPPEKEKGIEGSLPHGLGQTISSPFPHLCAKVPVYRSTPVLFPFILATVGAK